MKELIEMIVSNLIANPSELKITQNETDTDIIFEISVAADDIGRVIGKKGRIINAVRTVVKASSINSEKNVMIEIIS